MTGYRRYAAALGRFLGLGRTERREEDELEDEFRFHLEMQVGENLRRGMTPTEARRQAVLLFGGVEGHKEASRDLRPGRALEDVARDVRYGARSLRKQPGFTAAVVLTLALGIGANTAIFSVVNALMLRPLPFLDPERLVWVEEVSRENTRAPLGAHFLDWAERSQTLERIAAYSGASMTLTGEGEAERIEVGQISSGFLPLLGVQPLPPGRNMSASEDKPGGDRIALLSHTLWQQRYRGDPDIVGRGITLNDASYTVIGVLPESFRWARFSRINRPSPDSSPG